MARRFFIVRAIPVEQESGVTADCPPGWSGTPDVGRGVYVVMHPTWQPNAPVYGQDVQKADVEGLSDADFYALLPIRMPTTLTQQEVVDAANAVGLNPLPLSWLQKMSVEGS